MRPRDVRVYLADIVEAANSIAELLESRDVEDYLADEMLRSAVERQFEILGEAMKRALEVEPGLTESLAAARSAVDFRNVITHEYDTLAGEQVYDIATGALPVLSAEVKRRVGGAHVESAGRPACYNPRAQSPFRRPLIRSDSPT